MVGFSEQISLAPQFTPHDGLSSHLGVLSLFIPLSLWPSGRPRASTGSVLPATRHPEPARGGSFPRLCAETQPSLGGKCEQTDLQQCLSPGPPRNNCHSSPCLPRLTPPAGTVAVWQHRVRSQRDHRSGLESGPHCPLACSATFRSGFYIPPGHPFKPTYPFRQ